MSDFDWKSLVGTVAPGIATALAGPLAGAAVKVLGDKLLGKPDASADEVAAALSNGGLSGDQIVALKAAEQNFALEMAKINAASDAALIQDTANARQQTVDLAKAGSGIAMGAPLMSIMIVVGFFSCVYILLFIDRAWDERTSTLITTLFGALIPGFTQVCSYWLGSSNGSKKSGDAIREIAQRKG